MSTTETDMRHWLEKAQMHFTAPRVREAYECYLELTNESRQDIEAMILAIVKNYQAKRPSGNFGPASAFELLIGTWLKMPEIVKRRIRTIAQETNGLSGATPAYDAFVTKIKIKDRPQWFCWTCRNWHRSDTELDSCPRCGESLGDDGPKVAGWRER